MSGLKNAPPSFPRAQAPSSPSFLQQGLHICEHTLGCGKDVAAGLIRSRVLEALTAGKMAKPLDYLHMLECHTALE